MTVKDAMKELERRKEAVEKLIGERDKLSQTLDGLQKDRAMAVRDLAAGNEAKRKAINDLEAKISPLALRIEGLKTLIAEADANEIKAKEILEAVIKKEQAELTVFLNEREEEERAALIAGIDEREVRICDLYKQLCLEVGQLQIDKFRFGSGNQVKILEDMLFTLAARLEKDVIKSGLKPLLSTGSYGFLAILGLIEPYPEEAKGMLALNGAEVGQNRRKKARAAWTEEFYKTR